MVGRLFTINAISDRSAQVVIKKIMNRKPSLIAFSVFGYSKKKLDEMKLLKNEKIKITYSISANYFNVKYYNDIVSIKIERVLDKKEAPATDNLFDKLYIENNQIIGEDGKVRL